MSMFGPFYGNPTRIQGILFLHRVGWWKQLGGGSDIKCLPSILNGSCLFLWKKNEWVEVKPASFFFPATSPPAAFLDRCFVNLSLLRVSDFLSPIYIRNDLLTLSFPLQQVQWQPLDFLFSHDRCQTEVLRKNPSLSSHIAWDVISLSTKSKGCK